MHSSANWNGAMEQDGTGSLRQCTCPGLILLTGPGEHCTACLPCSLYLIAPSVETQMSAHTEQASETERFRIYFLLLHSQQKKVLENQRCIWGVLETTVFRSFLSNMRDHLFPMRPLNSRFVVQLSSNFLLILYWCCFPAWSWSCPDLQWFCSG